MTATREQKVRHVLRAGQSRHHHCHWPGCQEQVPPAKWGCRKHWFKLPKTLRDRIWQAYRPGQEDTQTPSRDYIAVARDVQAWIAANHPPAREERLL
ncbi:hypothetical protein [Reyranella sp.]|uniref:hypothetical protein n=1 Tax=Reyranella sp. TaxID=1929291 RepID=UPI003D0D8058